MRISISWLASYFVAKLFFHPLPISLSRRSSESKNTVCTVLSHPMVILLPCCFFFSPSVQRSEDIDYLFFCQVSNCPWHGSVTLWPMCFRSNWLEDLKTYMEYSIYHTCLLPLFDLDFFNWLFFASITLWNVKCWTRQESPLYRHMFMDSYLLNSVSRCSCLSAILKDFSILKQTS